MADGAEFLGFFMGRDSFSAAVGVRTCSVKNGEGNGAARCRGGFLAVARLSKNPA